MNRTYVYLVKNKAKGTSKVFASFANAIQYRNLLNRAYKTDDDFYYVETHLLED